MPEHVKTAVAIVDYGMGNLFSVLRACQTIGLEADVTNSRTVVLRAPAIILPGVGAFGVAMDNLHKLRLVDVLKEAAAEGKPLLGICLGMQLLMTESREFGRHQGLGIIEGDVVQLPEGTSGGCRLKVPQVGWNSIRQLPAGHPGKDKSSCWDGTVLRDLADGEYLYFVHSYYCRPVDDALVSRTRFGALEFCSTVRQHNVHGCQFHPERSGMQGLRVYRNFASIVHEHSTENHCG
jgi:glutamine amidotransferase